MRPEGRFRRRTVGVLLALVLAAFSIRVFGTGFGRDLGVEVPPGFSYHQDEPKTLLRALRIQETLDLDPRWFHYPSLGLYLNALALGAGSLFGDLDPYLVCRSLTALLGALSVAIVLGFGTRLGTSRAGVLGAALLAVSFLHVRSSHFVTTDVPATLFAALGAFFTVVALGGRPRLLLAGFACAGLAAGCKYNAATIGLVPLLGAMLLPGGPRSRILTALAGGAVSLLAFLATTPYLLRDPDTFRLWFDYVHEYQERGQFGFESEGFLDNLGVLTGALFLRGLGPVGLLLAVVGGAVGLSRWPRKVLPLVVFAVAYVAWLATYKTSFTRNLLPVVPILCALAGLGTDALLGLLERRGQGRTLHALGAGLLLAAVLAPPLFQSVTYDLAISRSTRTSSLSWFEENVPPGSRIAMEVYGPPLELRFPGRYDLWEMWNLGQNLGSVEILVRERDYVVSSSGAYEMAFSNPGRYPEAERIYREIEERFTLVKEFPGERVDPLYSSICPTIKVYAVTR